MRIGIGAITGIVGGPATYAECLVDALARQGGHDYVVFTDRPEAFADAGVEVVHVPLRRAVDQMLWDHRTLPRRLAESDVHLYHGTKGILPRRLRVPAVVTVHDLAVYAMPETFAWQQRLHFRLFVPGSVRRAARVIAVSEHTRKDVTERFGTAGERVVVVHNGVRDALRAPVAPAEVAAFRERLGLGADLIACIGTIQPRKGQDRVVEAFAASGLARDGWQLVIAGRLRPGHRPAWLGCLPPGVRWLGTLSDDDVRVLNGAAAIAVSASEYEGFGLTVAEAMAAGSAVIAVGVTSIPEVVGDAGVLLASGAAAGFARALRELADDPARRAALGERARARAARFTWAEAARRTKAVYDEVLG